MTKTTYMNISIYIKNISKVYKYLFIENLSWSRGEDENYHFHYISKIKFVDDQDRH